MNLLGKMLVVVITVMSIAFMGVAIALYSTHNNWKATIDDQQATIADLNADLERLQTAYKQNATNLNLEIETAEQQVRKLERERVAIAGRNEAMRSEIETLKQERRDTTTAIANTQAAIQRLAEENAQIEQSIARTQVATNTAFDKAVDATSELHEAKIKLETELERNAQLLEQVQGNF
jgi:chromosome segregation ATPase